MENFYVALNAVVPLFLMICAGCVVRRANIISDTAVRQANSMCFRVFMSTMMFYNVYTSDLSHAINVPLILFCEAGILVEFVLGYFIVCRLEKRLPVRGVMLQCFFRCNIVLLGVSMAQSIFGSDGIGEITILTAVAVPTVNILAVVDFELFRGGRLDVKHMLKGICKNPLVVGTGLGILAALVGLKLPGVVESAARSIANATTPLALVLLGASLDFRKFGSEKRNLIICLAQRLVISPAIFLGLAVALGFRGVPLMGVMVVFAAPVAVASFTVASEMGGDSDMAAELVLLTTGFSCVTMFCWIFLLKTLGLF